MSYLHQYDNPHYHPHMIAIPLSIITSISMIILTTILTAGTASELIKCSMIRVDHQLHSQWDAGNTPLPRLLMQIHDELVYEVHAHQVEPFLQLLREAMQTHVMQRLGIQVPLIINLHVGPTLGDLL